MTSRWRYHHFLFCPFCSTQLVPITGGGPYGSTWAEFTEWECPNDNCAGEQHQCWECGMPLEGEYKGQYGEFCPTCDHPLDN